MTKPEKLTDSATEELATAALQRAAQRARERAIATNTGIVIMKDGKIVFVSADELRAEQAQAARANKTR